MSTVPFAKGLFAYQRSLSTATCEHPKGSFHNMEWMRGWTSGQVADRAKDEDRLFHI